MADLASSAVVIDKISSQTLSNGIVMFRKECTVTLTGQGGTTNRILANAFGLSSISQTSNWVSNDATPKVVPAVFSYDRSMVLLANAADATATNHQTPADATGTYRCTVEGY